MPPASHELCPLLKATRRAARARRPQRHPARSACAAAGQSCAELRGAGGELHDRRSVSPRSNRQAGSWHVDQRERRALFGADPGQCRGRLGRCGRRARRRAADRAQAEAADDHHLRRAAGHRARRSARSPRPSATSFISRRRAGGCSPRRWTRCRASRCDAQPEEYEVALAAHRMEERTIVKVRNDPQPLGRPAHLHARPPSRRRVSRRTPTVSSGWRGRADSACRPRRRWRAIVGVADLRRSRGPSPMSRAEALDPGRFLGQPA